MIFFSVRVRQGGGVNAGCHVLGRDEALPRPRVAPWGALGHGGFGSCPCRRVRTGKKQTQVERVQG